MSVKKNAWSNQYSFPLDQPYNISHRFRNLENPLKFIENSDIVTLQDRYSRLQEDFKQGQQTKADFSKTIYKKVISRDNEYNFQHDLVGYGMDPTVSFNHKYSKIGQSQRPQERTIRQEDMQRRFKHGEVISLEQKRERLREQKQIPLTFQHVKLIDSPQFDELHDVQFYGLIRGDSKDKQFGHGGSNEISNPNVVAHLQNFKHKLIEQSQYHSKSSYNFLLNCDRQLRFWKVGTLFKEQQKKQDEVLANCAFLDMDKISVFDMFDFSSRNIQIGDIVKFYALKKGLNAKMEMEKNNESLQEKYNEAKKRFEQMKQNRLKSKNQRIPAKFISSVAQTNDQMKQKGFEDHFVQDAKDIFDRLKQLNDIRDRIIEQQEGETFNVMATNIGLQISSQLFKLLLVVLKGEDLSNYSQFIRAENQADVERKILELIYLQFKNFKQFQVNGISKAEIIKLYLYQRQKNERFYETYLIKKAQTAPTKSNTLLKPTKVKSQLPKTVNKVKKK